MPPKIVISHVSHDGKCIQSNESHLNGVASLAQKFANQFGMGDWGRVLGLLHDIGKERNSFQSYIMKKSGYDPNAEWTGQDKRHAYVGALLAKEIWGTVYPLLSYPIMGHHSGLDDCDDFDRKMMEPFPKEVNRNMEFTPLSLPKHMLEALVRNPKRPGIYFHHIIRMLYSCLVDADYLDTESFMEPESYESRQNKQDIASLLPKIESYLRKLKAKVLKSPLNKLRQQIQDRCRETAIQEPGLYSLTVPTGGGKTLSSVIWAMLHCVKFAKERIIIAIPYTSIVTQTAQILGEIFGKENVLEHHSNFDLNEINGTDIRHRLKLATENWNYPIVVTTNVQLFNSMFSNKPSKCRKLHNIANSVVILDETQMLPVEQMQPLIDSILSYNELFGTTFLFTTASLPVINGEIKSVSARLYGLPNIKEIIPPKWQLHDQLRRVNIKNIDEVQSYTSIAEKMLNHKRVLCIVNTRKDAREIYNALPQDDITIHLSRMMCTAHLRNNINRIKEALLKEDGTCIRVVSTQLLEAGVDIDFPTVYRQEAGLDSVLQAAGRCNREGKRQECTTYVFKFDKPPFGGIRRCSYAYHSINEDADLLDPETMRKYFQQLYNRITTFDKFDISSMLYEPQSLKFDEAANTFRLIDSDGSTTVYVNYGESPTLIERLKKEGPSYLLLKELSKYAVNVRLRDIERLRTGGLVETIHNTFFYINDKKQYDEKIGLIFENHWLDEILMI